MANENFYTSPASKTTLSNEAIAERAYQLWQLQGCPEGRDQENWFEAEKELALSAPIDESPTTPIVPVPVAATLSPTGVTTKKVTTTTIPLREEIPAKSRLSGKGLKNSRETLHTDKDMHIGNIDTPYEAFADQAPLATKVAQALADRDDNSGAPGLTSLDPTD